MGNLEIPIQEMEELEAKYGISLHVHQFEDNNIPDAYYIINDKGIIYIGETIDEVKGVLKIKYGY